VRVVVQSGNFHYSEPGEQFRKHSHLRFHDTAGGAICFEDYRRFGSWALTEEWGEERGPCILTENAAFVDNLRQSLDHSAFDKPICEVMLNQQVRPHTDDRKYHFILIPFPVLGSMFHLSCQCYPPNPVHCDKLLPIVG